jgi:glycine oxidase
VAGGLLIRPHAHVAAPALARALWASASTRGAIHIADRATRIASNGNGLAVDLAGGRVAAGSVVLAAGCWGGQIAIEGAPALPVRPVRGQLVEVKWPGPPLQRILWGPRCYIVPWRNGTGLIGATVEHVGYDERNTVAGVWDLIEAASNLLPAAWRASFVEARAGLRPDTPDQLPVIGASRRLPGLVYATGHYRNGVLLAPITATLVADLIVDRKGDPILDPLSPGRFGG